ncbi:unnamed protein product [Oikopleura dioica]|uniref:BAAT/Acyl-CoA thioester hydrolase C-terminal domain-containing protein n=1 Tax=Oikopleura dioica TaxID=34765 RepID=E4XSP3_OIKDI|nr:unnamed protein product [Oikopleura dioica]
MRSVPERILFGQRFSYYKKGLAPNISTNLNIKYHDTMGSTFVNYIPVKSDQFGRISLPEKQISDSISTSKCENTAFILKEFEKTTMEFELNGETEIVTVDSGVGDEIVKEELRGEIVGNLFYPSKGGKFPVIVHINGGVNHVQDARSSLLAREGYIVLELAYNVQEYGQPVLFLRDAFPLEYVEQSIKKVLAHDKAYGDTVVLIGQCKGADMATAFGSLRPDLVELVIGAVSLSF